MALLSHEQHEGDVWDDTKIEYEDGPVLHVLSYAGTTKETEEHDKYWNSVLTCTENRGTKMMNDESDTWSHFYVALKNVNCTAIDTVLTATTTILLRIRLPLILIILLLIGLYWYYWCLLLVLTLWLILISLILRLLLVLDTITGTNNNASDSHLAVSVALSSLCHASLWFLELYLMVYLQRLFAYQMIKWPQ